MNIEVLVINYLSTNLAGWSITGEVPKTLPDKFITVERTGGGRNYMVQDLAEVQVSVYHKNSKLTASEMANEIADIAHGIYEDYEDITKVSVNSIIQNDDTVRGYRRYLVFLDVYNRR